MLTCYRSFYNPHIMPVPLSVQGKAAVITGGSRGIGAACVRMFAEAGAKVAFNYQKAKEAAAKLVIECGSDRCLAVQTELDGTGGEKKLIDDAASRFGSVDIL